MKTGMNFRPLCTANVKPTMSGVIVERRDQVFTTRFSPDASIAFTFFMRCESMNGPFLTDRAIVSAPSVAARSGAPAELAAPPLAQLDIVNHGAERNVRERQAVPGFDVGARAGLDAVAHRDADGCQDVALLSIEVVEQRDPRRTVRIVLDGGD